jgi:hypothetical protein
MNHLNAAIRVDEGDSIVGGVGGVDGEDGVDGVDGVERWRRWRRKVAWKME